MTIQSRAVDAAIPADEAGNPAVDPGEHRRSLFGQPVLWIAAGAAVLRLAYLRAPMSPDEGGFLIVAQHWHAGGGSLYGPYWVDRPPLLIAFFGLANLLGGFTALRLLGCVVVALTVLGVAMAAAATADTERQAHRAGVWAAVVTAALLVTPTGGAVMVNGELLALPFIAFGVALAIRAVRGQTGLFGPDTAAVGAGVCAAAAVMVKQNMLDVAVFALVLGVVAAARREVHVATLLRRAGLAVLGGAATLVVILGAAFARGTTPWGVFYAMYPFRFRATEAMHLEPTVQRTAHLHYMLDMWAATGAPLVIAMFLVVLLLRRPAGRFAAPLAVAVLALAAYDAVSIDAGGSYWSHYLLQLVVPVALMSALLLARTPTLGRGVVVVVLLAGLAGWVIGTTARVPAAGVAVGAAIKDASQPDDTVVSMLGDGVLVRTSGLSSPYRYLWSLPAHVLDRRFTGLTSLLDSADRPSWVVVRGSAPTKAMRQLGPGTALSQHYRKVTKLCGREVYLRDDLTRPVPETTEQCTLPLARWNDDHATREWTPLEGEPLWNPQPRAR